MKRKKFIKTCGYVALGLPLAIGVLQSCKGIYYATVIEDKENLKVSKNEFIVHKKNGVIERDFVLVETIRYGFPICLYRTGDGGYGASLLKCTHRGCELNVGGGIYSCPCHGSQFSKQGKVLQGPADQNLKTFKTSTDNENIYINLS